MRQAFEITHQRLTAGIARLDEQALAQKAPFSPGNNPDETLQSLLTKIVVLVRGRSVHTGQVEALARGIKSRWKAEAPKDSTPAYAISEGRGDPGDPAAGGGNGSELT